MIRLLFALCVYVIRLACCRHGVADAGKTMELKAGTMTDARNWIKALQDASKGIVPKPTVSPAAPAAAPPPMISAAAAAAPAPAAAAAAPAPAAAEEPAPEAASQTPAPAAAEPAAFVPPPPPPKPTEAANWRKVATEDGTPYYYDEVSGTTTWDAPAGFTE